MKMRYIKHQDGKSGIEYEGTPQEIAKLMSLMGVSIKRE